jgi:hypothetical protein
MILTSLYFQLGHLMMMMMGGKIIILVVQIVNLPQVPRALCLRNCVVRRSNSPLFSLLSPCYEAK